MHPPSDSVGEYLYEFRDRDLVREAERMRLADQCPDPGIVARVRAVLAPWIGAWQRRVARGVMPRSLGAAAPERAISDPALEM
jgi:hypothetical protein